MREKGCIPLLSLSFILLTPRSLSFTLIGLCFIVGWCSSKQMILLGSFKYSILFYSILFYSILFYSILFYSNSILFYSILFYSILFYSILFYSIPFHSIPFHSIPFHSIHPEADPEELPSFWRSPSQLPLPAPGDAAQDTWKPEGLEWSALYFNQKKKGKEPWAALIDVDTIWRCSGSI